MDIISLKDFYAEKDNKDISLYLEYLDSKKQDIEEGLAVAVDLLDHEDPTFIDIQNQLNFVEKLQTILINSIGELIVSSARKMDMQELASIVNVYLESYNKERQNILQTINDLTEKKDELLKDHAQSLDEGYKKQYYEAEDTSIFFSEIKSGENYMVELVNSSLEVEELKKTFALLNYTDEINDKLANMIINLRRFAKISDEKTLRKAINSFLTPEKIGKIVGIKDEQACLEEFKRLQNELKVKTEFFANLPESIRNDIIANNIVESEAYTKLRSIYSDYQKNGDVTIPENEDVTKLNEKIAYNKFKLSKVDEKIAELSKTTSNRELMENFVLSIFDSKERKMGDTVSSLNANKALFESIEVSKKSAAELSTELDVLSEQEKKIKNVLLDPNDDFSKIEKRKKLKELEAAATKMEDISVQNRLRCEQFEILYRTINTLNKIKYKIQQLDADHNLIRNISGSNKKARENLLREYKQTMDEGYSKLCQKGVNDACFSDDSRYKEPNFDTFISRTPVLDRQISRSEFEELMLVYDERFRELELVHEWPREGNYGDEVFERVKFIASKIFGASKNSDGIYDFDINSDELNEMTFYQYNISKFYGEVYAAIEDVREWTEAGNKPLSQEFVKLLNDLGIKEDEVSKEVLGEQKNVISRRISDIKNELEKLNSKINKASELDTIALELYQLLDGFYETSISNSEIKNNIRL